MKKTLLILSFISVFGAVPSFAQINNNLMNAAFLNSHASKYFPGRLGTDFKRFEIQLPYVYFWAGNSTYSQKDFKSLYTEGNLTNALIDELVGKLDNKNVAGGGAEAQLLAIRWNMMRDEEDGEAKLSFELAHNERFEAGALYGPNLFKLIYQGNKQFAGETINIDPLAINAMAWRELSLAGALGLDANIAGHDIGIRPALRFKLLTSSAAVYTKESEITMFTQEDGRRIDFGFNYDLNTAVPDSNSSFNPFQSRGHGFAADLGVSLDLPLGLSADLGLRDLGSISFAQDVTNYRRSGSYTYEGVIYTFNDDDSMNQLEFDSLTAIFDPTISNEAFTVRLPTQFVFQAAYGAGAPKSDNSGQAYHTHNIYFTYLQGLGNRFSATSRPYMGVGYTFNLKNVLSLGVNTSVGGYNKYAIGAALGLNAGPVKLFAGSNSLLSLAGLGSGIDGAFSLALSF